MSTAKATAAHSCGTGDRSENERRDLESAVKILEFIQNEDGSAFELVAVVDKWRRKRRLREQGG